MSVRQLITAVVFFFMLMPQKSDKQIEIRGIYGHPQLFWNKGYTLSDLNVNAIFLHHGGITDSFMLRAKAEKLKVYAEFATLNGEDYVEKHPEAWAIDKEGKKVSKADWFMGVCPTDTGFLNYRLDQLKTLLTKHQIDGVWLDYLHWHAQFEDPEPILPETCFNGSCVNRFSRETGIKVTRGTDNHRAAFILKHHEKRWRQWRAQVLADWVKQCKKVVKELRPEALLGIYHCPWNDVEFDSARYKILGLDYRLLEKETDVFSPMVYHKRMGKSPEWVKENIEWFSKKISREDVSIWPIVQAYNDPSPVSAKEFENVLRNGASGATTGIMMFTSNSVAEDSLKVQVMKKIYGEWRQGNTAGRHWAYR